MQLSEIVFMDSEASALRDGYPVEVGWAWVEGSDVQAESMLISPADEWLTPSFVWDPIAEGLHGLPLARLRAEGVTPSEVCDVLNERLQDKIVVFDTGPDGVDRHWLDLLYFEGGQHRHFKLGGSASEVLLALAAGHGLTDADLLQIKKWAPEATHHAAIDAAHYAWCAAAIQLMTSQMPDEGIERIVHLISVRGAVRK
ncbi:hypothetical protein [uncultured Ferrovibrio sp.]|jgi:hypothetical protein|uniref:hypothetical protein n=1 Tax=uncultured Ferrovibrio sp. TaxID=1576913 RepID=UPI00260B84E6|nr:hypothetical protein [uncultured Ferrovibrio sp.]